MINIRNVSRHFEDTLALENVSLEIPAGQVVGLLGQNGAGKTTLLRIITGSLMPSSGSVTIGAQHHPAPTVQAKARIGYLPENCPLYEDMLVHEYLTSIAALRGLPRKGRIKAAQQVAEELGLSRYFHQPIHTLSKGYKQRVGLAQALIHDPEIVILDEPTSGLDPGQMIEIQHVIQRLGESKTVLLSTHNLNEVEGCCDRIVIMVNGTLALDRTLGDLVHLPHTDISIQAGAQHVKETLTGIEGVTKVTQISSENGHMRWRLHHAKSISVGRQIIALAQTNHWLIDAVQPGRTTLADVFHETHSARAETQ